MIRFLVASRSILNIALGAASKQRGSAMVITLLVMSVLTGLGSLIFNVGAANLLNSTEDRLAGGAMGSAEAGVAHALAYMRAYGTAQMTCDGPSTASALCSTPWGYNHPSAGAGGHTVLLNGGRAYRAWVQRVQAYSPSAGIAEGKYRIYTHGTGGTAGGARSLNVEVVVKPFDYPIGIFASDYVRAAGQTQITTESIFSSGCIGQRDHINFNTSANDLAHPELVPGAHSTKWISTGNVTSTTDADCSATEKRNIHRPATSNPQGPGYCNASYRFDQDGLGGSLSGTLCDPSFNGGRGLPTPPGSYFDDAALRSYGYREPRGLPANQYAFIRAIAQEQGNYYDCTATPLQPGCNSSGDLTNMTAIAGGVRPNVVVYAKLSPGKKLTLTPSLLSGYGESYCGSRSLMLVVEGGDLTLNNNLDFVGAIFVPDGRVNLMGDADIVGTVFSKQLFLTGSSEFTLKGQCFFDNLPGGLLSVNPVGFAEIDR